MGDWCAAERCQPVDVDVVVGCWARATEGKLVVGGGGLVPGHGRLQWRCRRRSVAAW
jgi:hypothetical protein